MIRQLVALVRKDLQLFRADRRALIVSFAVPAILATLFGVVFRGNSGSLHLSSRVVNLDGSPGSVRLADALVHDPVLSAQPATQAEAKIAKTTNRPALRSADSERSRKAMPSGIAVAASPKLWIRSASRATLPVAM